MIMPGLKSAATAATARSAGAGASATRGAISNPTIAIQADERRATWGSDLAGAQGRIAGQAKSVRPVYPKARFSTADAGGSRIWGRVTGTMSLTDSIEARARKVAAQPLVVTNRRGGFFGGSLRSAREIWAQRGLLYLLIRREVRSRYKNSTLGIVWSLARPLVQLAIYYFAIGHVLGARGQIPDFAIFVFIGITMWGLFADIVSGATTSLNANAGLVKKVYLPREIFPLATAGSALFNFAVQLVVLLGAITIWSSFAFDARLLLAPLSVAVLLAFATALGLLFSAVNVYLRDTEHFVEIGLLLGFWFAPIVYSYTFVHNQLHGNWLEQIFLANPVTLAVIGMQRALWTAGSQPAELQSWPAGLEVRLVIALVASLALLWLTQRIFARLQGNFAQEM